MFPAASHIVIQAEKTRLEVIRWLRGRWVDVKRAGGFDTIAGWSLKELSHGEQLGSLVAEIILM